MAAGKYRHRITIYSTTTTVDSWGDSHPTATAIATVWADVVASPAKEILEAGKTTERRPYIIRMRYRSDVTATCYALEGGVQYNFTSVTPVAGRTKELEIHATVTDAVTAIATTTRSICIWARRNVTPTASPRQRHPPSPPPTHPPPLGNHHQPTNGR